MSTAVLDRITSLKNQIAIAERVLERAGDTLDYEAAKRMERVLDRLYAEYEEVRNFYE